MQTINRDQKKAAVLIMNNQIVRNAVKDVLGRVGFEVLQDIELCRGATVGFVGSYFALLGILRHVRLLDPALPLVLIMNVDYMLDEESELLNDYYDVIRIDSNSEVEVKQKVTRWFAQEKGRFLVKCEGG